ncbi:hydroxymethylbilane synthase [Azospirillum lipoferum]|uniref:Porphobilinogen deaminase n=1 Tax=Azospirillum lipoferum TaxID=193 RepID=A0A5A9GWJ9_AZOLI|nr:MULTISPECIES: hydroxymethylbilane synthase [Azospirillum]KAA0597944.1 hydroxymethylbilane synthase [Azospirillum lipoferum]MCP1609911.1 hydroxymethylbilane synthase [Azospirillum lipoferum]MDW5534596.1 hydroxymethylbilane synthase [Azospirillum sp. NL1]
MTTHPLRIGTRGSPLALAQAHETRDRLIAAHPHLAAPGAIEIVVFKTTGDRILDRTLAEAGGKGLFTKELEEALFDGRADLAVHSMKDVPTQLPDGLEIATLLPREDPRDAFFARSGSGLADLPAGSVVGTAGLRRQAQVLELRPDLKIFPLRGNVQTRLSKLDAGEVDATLLALAGLRRLGLTERITAVLEPETMLPAVAQGAIGIEIRSDDDATRALLAPLNCAETMLRVTAERALLAALDGSCRTPIAALAVLDGDDLHLRAKVLSPDGRSIFRAERRGKATDAESLGADAGAEIRAQLPPDFFAAAPH